MKAAAARDAAEQFAERKARRKAMAGKSNEIANFLQRQSLAERLDARTRQVLFLPVLRFMPDILLFLLLSLWWRTLFMKHPHALPSSL
jgi:hypothetical protein